MTEPAESNLNETSEARLLRTLTQRLSNEEKMLRDHELAQQAYKYFGGLNRQERTLLGMEGGTAVKESAATIDIEEGLPVESSGAKNYEWIWAILSAVAFAAVCAWVIGVR